MEEWIDFFLDALLTQTNKSIKLIDELEAYREELHIYIYENYQSHNMHTVVDMLFRQPVLSKKEAADHLDMSLSGATHIVDKFEDEDILDEITGKKNMKKYACHTVLDILENPSY